MACVTIQLFDSIQDIIDAGVPFDFEALTEQTENKDTSKKEEGMTASLIVQTRIFLNDKERLNDVEVHELSSSINAAEKLLTYLQVYVQEVQNHQSLKNFAVDGSYLM